MTPSEIKHALAEVGGSANKRLGQHFLISPAVLSMIVSAANIVSGDRVLEIGPGLGVLTNALLDRGATVTAIERDRRFVERFHKEVESHPDRFKGLQVVQGDAATLDWSPFTAGSPWKFVANLPYSITSLALRKALWDPHPPTVVVVLVQREVAERAIAKNGRTSLLSLMVALASTSAKIVRRVSQGAFFPPPKVESAVLCIEPMSWEERMHIWGVHPERIMEVAKKGFSHPRKLLASNLGLDASGRERLTRIGISLTARAETLTPSQWAELAKGE